MAVGPTPNRMRDAERTKEAILESATVLFAAQGYEATSVQQVAEAARVARATPSYFFGSKEGLWRSVLEAQNQAASKVIPAALDRLSKSETPEARVHALVDVYFTFLAEQPHFSRLIQWSELQHNPVINDLPSHWEVLADALIAVHDVLESGDRPDQDPRQVLMSVIAICNAHVVYGNTLGKPLGVDVNEPAFVEARKAHLKSLLVAALL